MLACYSAKCVYYYYIHACHLTHACIHAHSHSPLRMATDARDDEEAVNCTEAGGASASFCIVFAVASAADLVEPVAAAAAAAAAAAVRFMLAEASHIDSSTSDPAASISI